MRLKSSIILAFLLTVNFAFAQDHGHEAPKDQEVPKGHETTNIHEAAKVETVYSPTTDIMNHIANTHEFHLFGHYTIPLPCIFYVKEEGAVKTFMSSVFHHGAEAHDKFVSDHGVVKRVKDASFPDGEVALEAFESHDGGEAHYVHHDSLDNGFVKYQGKEYEIEKGQGLFTSSSFFDFSITKNVFTMIMSGLILLFLFSKAASGYKKRPGQAPSGIQNVLEPVVQFITDDVAKPMIGDKYMKFLPYLLTVFFFILANNLIGLIPFAPFGANVTGNIATTAALALIAFLITNLNGKADYWKHIFWMPGVHPFMKVFLAPIEFIGVFTKPISLMIRLFANITAGHIIILALVSLIFVFGNAGKSVPGSIMGTAVAVPFTLFLSIIEVIVAFIQAFIFTILTASYIGAAIEEHHHEEAHH
jgi:F-type H+-transporting ATPase subunit a